MSYPQGPPGNPGYPPAQQPTTQFAAPTQQFGRAPEPGPAGPAGPSKLPNYLTIAVAVLGLLVYLSSFGPVYVVTADGPFGGGAPISVGTGLYMSFAIVASLLAALLGGAALLPRQAGAERVAAVFTVLAFLLVIAEIFSTPDAVSIGWGFYLIIAFTAFQAIAAVAALLFDAGIITSPAPRQPRYDQPHYGQYGGPGAHYSGQAAHGGPPPQQQGVAQRPGYPSQYGGYPGGGPPTGGYDGGQHSGTPTPPTGFPAYGQPPGSSAPTTESQLPPQSGASSAQSGPPPS
jgi:hypothetical protein